MAEDPNPNSSSAENALPSSPASELHTTLADDLRRASDPGLTEDLALALLKRADLPAEVLEQLSKNANVLRLRKVKVALAGHPYTPRHVSIPLIRQFYTFDLMQVAITPTVPADVKVVAEDVLAARLKTITMGERLTLARRASGRVAGALLLDAEPRIMRTALENGRLTEQFVIQAVLRPEAKVALVRAVAQHGKWSLRREVRLALLRTEFLPLSHALVFSRDIPKPQLREILLSSRLPTSVKEELIQEANRGSAS